jgi:hypothetical protein
MSWQTDSVVSEADDRFGSKGAISGHRNHVCFALERGHLGRQIGCLGRANIGSRENLLDHFGGLREQRWRHIRLNSPPPNIRSGLFVFILVNAAA